jgi:hypothetical protein
MKHTPISSQQQQLEHTISDRDFFSLQHSKACKVCAVLKPLSDYDKVRKCRSGLRNTCRDCRNVQRREAQAKKYPPGTRRPRNWKRDIEYSNGRRRRHVILYLIQAAKRRARKKKIQFDIDQHMDELIERGKPMRCELSGIPLQMANGTRDYNSISLDRVDGSKGYTIDNVRIVCWAINAAAGTWGLKRVVEIFNLIKEDVK